MLLGQGCGLSAPLSLGVCLIELVTGEIGGVEEGAELWFEGSVDGAKVVPSYAGEEGVVFDLLSTVVQTFVAETVGRIAEEAGGK